MPKESGMKVQCWFPAAGNLTGEQQVIEVILLRKCGEPVHGVRSVS
jgi:hypothetical protein